MAERRRWKPQVMAGRWSGSAFRWWSRLRGPMPGRHRDPVQILGEQDRAAERRRGLFGQRLVASVLIALREMGEDEQPGARLGGDAARLPGGQVPVVASQSSLAVGEGGL